MLTNKATFTDHAFIVKKGRALNFPTVFVLILTYGHESWEMTERVRSQRQASEIRFLRKSKELHCLTKCVALRFENLLTSSRYFSELKDLSLDGLAM